MRRQRGLTLIETSIAIVVSLGIIATVAALGGQAIRTMKAEATANDVRRVLAEARRVYGESPTAYTGITAANLNAATSALSDLYLSDVARFKGGDGTLEVLASSYLPAGVVGAAGDAVVIYAHTGVQLCKAMVSTFAPEANRIEVYNGGTLLATFGGTSVVAAATPAAINTACNQNLPALTVRLHFT